jgi:multidrug efflux pump subunit AcrA (membrane-fusion protein)
LNITIRLLILAFVWTTTVSAATTSETRAVPVSVARSLTRTLEIKIEAPGELESLADPVIAAEVAGRVLEVFAREGDGVEAHQLLARLDPEPYEINLE